MTPEERLAQWAAAEAESHGLAGDERYIDSLQRSTLGQFTLLRFTWDDLVTEMRPYVIPLLVTTFLLAEMIAVALTLPH